jgi:RHS repeat-associated protein
VQVVTSKVPYNLRYPGQYYDEETGLNYNYFRDYDPQTGRYIESDPIGLHGGSLSTYTYIGDGPLAGRDIFGLKADGIDQFVDKAIELYKKVCKQKDEDCQHYANKIYKMCVGSGYGLTGVACKLVEDHFVEVCIESPQDITCNDSVKCGIRPKLDPDEAN